MSEIYYLQLKRIRFVYSPGFINDIFRVEDEISIREGENVHVPHTETKLNNSSPRLMTPNKRVVSTQSDDMTERVNDPGSECGEALVTVHSVSSHRLEADNTSQGSAGSSVNESRVKSGTDSLDVRDKSVIPSPGTSPILAYPGDKRQSTPKRKPGKDTVGFS